MLYSRTLRKAMNRKSLLARLWSNEEIRRLGAHFEGEIVSVSGAKDADKEGGRYRDYFPGATAYHITNYPKEGWGHFQGASDEISLDLTAPLPEALRQRYDVVFNHTTLEHIYEVGTAFANLCAMSRDIVLVVVPFLQEMHCPSEGGDYWRFTPLTLKRMFEDNGFSLLQCTFNSHSNAAVYLCAVGSRQPERWPALQTEFSYADPRRCPDQGLNLVGCHALREPFSYCRSLFRAARRRLLGGGGAATDAG